MVLVQSITRDHELETINQHTYTKVGTLEYNDNPITLLNFFANKMVTINYSNFSRLQTDLRGIPKMCPGTMHLYKCTDHPHPKLGQYCLVYLN